MKRFEDFNLKETTIEFIKRNGFQDPTPIQGDVVPLTLRKKDLIGISKTGTGKTHAYLIPMMEKVDPSRDTIQFVITAPTRELAMQIYDKAKVMQEILDIRIGLFVGGQDRSKDIEQLSKAQPHIVVGTPGRIKDLFLEQGILRLDLADMLVVDEADMTLEYGFLPDIDAFAGRMKDDLQMLAFSATIPDQLKPFLKKYMHHPFTVKIEDDAAFNPKIKHVLVPCYHHTYAQTIQSILPGFQPFVCLIFTNTREEAKQLAQALKEEHISVLEIHGDLESRKRKQALKQLQENTYTYVVCTDLAARGIDIDAVTHVISCGFPSDLQFYIHRSGRTGRGGKSGTCYALYHESDDQMIRTLMNMGVSFQHARYKNGKWATLRPYGQKRVRKEDEMDKKISMMMTKKNTKVKPGYKKKRAAAIEKLQKQKRRDFIRAKIKEEKKAMYKKHQIELNKAKNGK